MYYLQNDMMLMGELNTGNNVVYISFPVVAES